MSALLETLREGAPYTWIEAALAVACGAAIVAATIVQLGRGGRRLPALVAFGPALGALGALLAVAAAGAARGRAIVAHGVLVGEPDPSMVATLVAEGVSLQLNALACAAIAAPPLVGLLAIGAMLPPLVASARERQPAAAPLLLGAALAGPLGLALLAGALPYLLRVLHVFAAVPGVEPTEKGALLDAGLREAMGALLAARIAILALALPALACACVAAALWARRGRTAGNAAFAVAAAIFLVGAAAFVATRGEAADGEPLPPWNLAGNFVDPRELGGAPSSRRCGELQPNPVLALHADGAYFDGRPVAPDDYAEQLATLRNNYLLLHPEGDPAKVVTLLAAPSETPLARLAPYLRASAGRGMRGFVLVAVQPRFTDTRTLGRIDRPRMCALPFTVEDSGAPAARFRTWGDLAAALDAAPAPLAVAP